MMSDSQNPFASAPPSVGGRPRGETVAWVIAAAMTLGALTLGMLWSRDKRQLESQLVVLRETVAESAAKLARATAEWQTNRNSIAALQKQVADLQEEKASVGQKARSLEDEMRAQLESKDVTISQLQGKLTVTIVDRVMFDSGEAELKPDGAAVMQKIATLLAGHPELKIHVIGHTDNVPIRPTAQSRFASNWELSTARALAAVHFLTEKAGVDARRVGAVGYGEYRPIADNATTEGRAKNRRIAITILPDELAGADTTPMIKGSAITNAAPAVAPEATAK